MAKSRKAKSPSCSTVTRAAEIDPELFRAQLQLGILAARAGDFDDARHRFDLAIASADDDFELAEAHAKKGVEFADAEPAEALEHLRRYRALAPDDPALLAGRIAQLEADLAGG